MNSVNAVVANIDSKVSGVITTVQGPTIIRGAVYLFLMLYAAQIAQKPPAAVQKLFSNGFFKLFIFSMILWTARFSPSTSIMIALAFMITINYTARGTIWENMQDSAFSRKRLYEQLENTPTVADSVTAVAALKELATSPEPAPLPVVQTLVDTATVNIQTVEGAKAVAELADKAVMAVPAEPETAQVAVDTAVKDLTAISPERSVVAIEALATAAASPASTPVPEVQALAQVAMANVQTPLAAESVQALAQQAAVPEAGVPAKVMEATQTAISGIVPPQVSLEAVQKLTESAASVEAADTSATDTLAQVALANSVTDKSNVAIQQLAQQSVVAAPGAPEKIADAKEMAVEGCFQMRNYDMSKVITESEAMDSNLMAFKAGSA